MFKWLRRRRLSAEGRRKLLIVTARAEEAVIETHVSNVLDLLHTLSTEIDIDRALELYQEAMPLEETIAATVTNRVLARHDGPAAPAGRARRFENVFRDEPR